MRQSVKILLLILVFPIIASASEVWKSTEEIEVNGKKITKQIYVTEDMMKTINTADSGGNETIIDLKNDKITMINHKTESYQIIKLSKYVEFAEQLAEDIKARGHISTDEVIPQLKFEKVKDTKLNDWDCEEWTVILDGKPYRKIWVSPELKEAPILKFKNKFGKIIPDSLVKYKSINSRIDKHFMDKGMVIKSVRISTSKRVPEVTQTVKSIKPVTLKSITVKIPANYLDKSAPETTQTSETKSN
jgi:hypothetical protein